MNCFPYLNWRLIIRGVALGNWFYIFRILRQKATGTGTYKQCCGAGAALLGRSQSREKTGRFRLQLYLQLKLQL